jgi:transcriptional regulator with XRE-family HTH domain
MGLRIKEAREKAGLSREALAVRLFEMDEGLDLGPRRSSVATLVRSAFRWEIRTAPSVRRLAQIADVLGVPMHWLATGEEPSAPARSPEAAA